MKNRCKIRGSKYVLRSIPEGLRLAMAPSEPPRSKRGRVSGEWQGSISVTSLPPNKSTKRIHVWGGVPEALAGGGLGAGGAGTTKGVAPSWG